MGLDWHKWDSDRHRLAWGRRCSWVTVVFLAIGCRESWDWWLWQKMDLIWFCFVFFFVVVVVVVVVVVIIIVGPKGSRDFSPFHIKSKAHAEEEKVPKDE